MVWRMALYDSDTAEEAWVPEDTFGSRLAQIRQRLGLNTARAAERCSLSDESWRQWEKGSRPRDYEATCRQIAAQTGCSLAWLMSGDQNWKLMMGPDLQLVHGRGTKRTMDRALLVPVPD